VTKGTIWSLRYVVRCNLSLLMLTDGPNISKIETAMIMQRHNLETYIRFRLEPYGTKLD